MSLPYTPRNRRVATDASGKGTEQPTMYRKLIRANTRTTQFLARSAGRGLRHDHVYPEIPTRAVSPSLAMSVWVDEVVMGLLPRMPDVARDEVSRLGAETDQALSVLERNGWLADPAAFHIEPPAPRQVTSVDRRLGATRFTRISFDSDFQPHRDLPGRDRWLTGLRDNRAFAYVLEHQEPDRPWLINLHGYSSGHAFDLTPFRSVRLHRELGYNVIHPVLPLHGPRTPKGRRSGQGFLTFDYVQHLHSFAHGVWDVRRTIAWLQQRGATSIALHGISLGAMLTALVSSVDGRVDRAIVGTPLVDMAFSVERELQPAAKTAYEELDLLGDRLHQLHRVVTPLAMECRVDQPNRYLYAGVADRMTTPGEAHRLWLHWDRPTVCWYAGSHCASSWSREAHQFVRSALANSVATA